MKVKGNRLKASNQSRQVINIRMTKHVFQLIWFNLARFSDSLIMISSVSLIFTPLSNMPYREVVMASSISLIFFLLDNRPILPYFQRGFQFNLARFSDSLVRTSSVSLFFDLFSALFSPLDSGPRLPFAKRGCQWLFFWYLYHLE